MYYKMSINSCRICLENTAHLPIFDSGDSDKSINYKLSMCLKDKIEDLEGYPRYICEACKIMLDKFCDFINKYKESTFKLLKNGLKIVKEEIDLVSFNDQPDDNGEVTIVHIKKELETINSEGDASQSKHLIKPTQKNIKINKEGFKRVRKKRVASSRKSVDISNKIASSILEGEFSWDGGEWCLSSTKIKITKPKQISLNSGRRVIKIPIPETEVSNPPKLCDLCGEVFQSHEKLTVHKKRFHNTAHSQCKDCLKTFGSNYDLKRHVKRKHDIEKNFVCPICGKGFSFRGEQNYHYRNVHEKHLKPKKEYKCQYCSKTYKCPKSVEIHERSAHTGYRPAVCAVCGTSFFHEDYLREHMRLHTGETPFKCPICGRGYAQRGNMKSHLRIHKISELDDETLSKLRPNYLKRLKA